MKLPLLPRFRLPRLVLPLFAGAALLLGSAAALQAQKPAAVVPPAERGRILLLTRHCEKDPAGDARDPGLSEAGRKRAAALQHLLEPQAIDATFASEFKRAHETAEEVTMPRGRAPGKAISKTVPAAEPDKLFAALDALHAGETALVVGHSNTIPGVLAHYGVPLVDAQGKTLAMMPETEFGTLFVVTLPPAGSTAGATMLKLHYGD